MKWANNRRQWAIQECARAYLDQGDHPLSYAMFVERWIAYNTHRFRTDDDKTPITSGQIQAFKNDVIARITPRPDIEIEWGL